MLLLLGKGPIVGVSNPVPEITSVTPDSAVENSGVTQFTVAGTGFMATSTVKVDGSPTGFDYGSPTSLSLNISIGAVGSDPGITVTNPTPGGGESNAMYITVYAA